VFVPYALLFGMNCSAMRIVARRSFGRERTNGREGERIFHAAQR
jgi:hypothetical protein